MGIGFIYTPLYRFRDKPAEVKSTERKISPSITTLTKYKCYLAQQFAVELNACILVRGIPDPLDIYQQFQTIHALLLDPNMKKTVFRGFIAP